MSEMQELLHSREYYKTVWLAILLFVSANQNKGERKEYLFTNNFALKKN